MTKKTSFKRKRQSNSNKNPLYMVSKDGKDVEEVGSFFDLWIKKLGLAPVLEIIQQLLSQVDSYQMFILVKTYIDEIINKIMLVLSPVEAILNGQRNRRL